MMVKHPKRILLKISGETLRGSSPFGIEIAACRDFAASLKKIQDQQIELAIVVGGGNIFRGIHLSDSGFARSPSDQMGMLATLMNGVALKQSLQLEGSRATMMSALHCPTVAEPYQWERANDLLKKGEIVIFVGGTGNPYFTTDTAAALRASEINADLLMKATKVDGIFDKDPLTHQGAIKYDTLTFSETLSKQLGVMDSTAIVMCMNNAIPILIFNMHRLKNESIQDIIARKEGKGSLIC